jgi:hypothetical protein
MAKDIGKLQRGENDKLKQLNKRQARSKKNRKGRKSGRG